MSASTSSIPRGFQSGFGGVINSEAMRRYERPTASDHIDYAGADMAKEYVPYDGPIVTRADAKAAGLRRYFMGKPCKYGHLVQRITSGGACMECARIRARGNYQANPELCRQQSADYRRKNPDKVKAGYADYYARNADGIRAWARENYYANRDHRMGLAREWKRQNKDAVAAYQVMWNKENADLARERRVIYRQKNADAIRAKAAEYRAANMDMHALYERNRRALKRSADGNHTREDVEAILKAQRGRCAYCRKPFGAKFHVDHIVPLSLGGSNDRRNLQACCPRCNTSKNNKRPEVFARSLGMLL